MIRIFLKQEMVGLQKLLLFNRFVHRVFIFSHVYPYHWPGGSSGGLEASVGYLWMVTRCRGRGIKS